MRNGSSSRCAAAWSHAAGAHGAAGRAPHRGASRHGVVIDSVAAHEGHQVLAHDSMEGRATGTRAGTRARASSSGRFRERGLQPLRSVQGPAHPFSSRSASLAGQRTSGANVVGVVPGTGVPDRYIVVTAHYDHLGIRNGEIYNGADDNASGSAGCSPSPPAFRSNPPRHSIIFAAFDAEEMGLQGARAFVANPPVPTSRPSPQHQHGHDRPQRCRRAVRRGHAPLPRPAAVRAAVAASPRSG
jgi:Zn-dependent M28 family amino/carboxypeptidase